MVNGARPLQAAATQYMKKPKRITRVLYLGFSINLNRCSLDWIYRVLPDQATCIHHVELNNYVLVGSKFTPNCATFAFHSFLVFLPYYTKKFKKKKFKTLASLMNLVSNRTL